jgi:hypothetical protein
MWSMINAIFDNLPPLKSKKEPVIAFVLGFCCGGIGLGIYFRSPVDLIIPLVILLILSVAIPVGGIVVGAAVAGTYGVLRVLVSNAKLDKQAAPPQA